MKKGAPSSGTPFFFLLRGQDLNLRPLGYEPSELPSCSTPRHKKQPNTGFEWVVPQAASGCRDASRAKG